MTDWTDGYVSDVAYTEGFYRRLTPAHLDAACLVVGVEPPVEPDAPFAYCELGCGLGHTAMAIAAGDPRGQVWGFDFNPSHIAHARSLAARTGLDNVHFVERSFEELAEAPSGELPTFDYITLHGVWSWVSLAARAHIVTFLRRNLRPGGLVYVGYNAMPGWASVMGLQHLLFETGRIMGGGSEYRIRAATALARRMADAGCLGIDRGYLELLERVLADGNISYAVHEYMNEHWRPSFFAEVAGALASAKLEFVGSANLLENFPHFCMKAEHAALVESLPPSQRETTQDYFCTRPFRCDVFMRGPRQVPPQTLRARLDAQRLALTVPARLTKLKVDVPAGEATLGEAFYKPALAILADGNATVGDLRRSVEPETAPVAEEIIGTLAGGGQAMSAPGKADPDAVARVRRYNRERLALSYEGAKHGNWIVGTVIASAMRVGVVEMLVYEVVAGHAETGIDASTDTIFTEVTALLEARGMQLKANEPEAKQGLLAEIRTIVAERMPIWRRIGAL